ncbi:Ger(x)C family spore germination protein [Bacillus sp. HMF5848]|uniref:Ger(x)C family spore germination protein n=1 Tax=Bacillus sp. HMF5848 TaxID=2495421 RepID=UPI000F7A93B3|nr:Ger(x)C family spore germination protein [Bacillus sp. HMF5848]RSK25946.1 Ger(x)C family spore germination protein [Bacillus sp. HMF5848]
MIYKLLFLLMSCLVLTGCWDKVELNDITLATGIAIEKGEKAKYKLTVESLNSPELTKDATGNTPATTFSVEGNSVSELADKMNVGLTRRLIYSHTRLLVIDEALASEGLLSFLDFLERSGEFRNDFNIMIVKDAKASDVLKVTYPFQKSPSLKIHTQADTMLHEWGGDPKVRLTDFIEAIISDGKEPIAAAITIQGDPKKGQSIENNQKLDLDALVVFYGSAVFHNDTFVGYLNLEDTRNYLWTQDLYHTSLSVPCNKSKENPLFIDVRVLHSSSRQEVEYKHERPYIKVRIVSEARLQGVQCGDDITKIDTIKKYERFTEDYIKSEIARTIRKVQEEYGVDIFGFGETMNRQHYDEFQKVKETWNEEFKRAEIEVEVDMYLRRSGIRNRSFITDLNELKEKQQEDE